jgi:hypothetical protein
MRVKRIGPSLIPTEVVVPSSSLAAVLRDLDEFIELPLVIEGVGVRGDEFVLLGFIPHDERTLGYNVAFGLALSVIKAAKYGSLMGVGVMFGASAWKIFKNQDKVRGRFVVGTGGSKSSLGLAVPTEQSATQMFIGSPEVRTSYMIYDANPEGKAESISFLLDSTILVFARKAAPTRRDPSFMKTFRLMNKFMVPGSYMRDDGRVEVAKFDWSEDVQVTNSAACVRLNISAT